MKRGFATRGNFHTLSKVPKNIGFRNRQKSHFQFINMRKIFLHKAWYSWNAVFNDWTYSHFQASKMKKFPLFARYLETLVTRIVGNRIIRMSKCVKFAHTNLRTIELWVSRLGKYRIFYLPQCGKWDEEC